MKKTELLAPAGDMSCLKAAIAAGADAVYLGGRQYGARAFAGNFTDEELLEALKLAHLFGKKIYLTVNTLTKDEELDGFVDWLSPFYEAGLDGLIIQDLGLLSVCGKAFPEIELHASTQMTVTESETALFLKGLGVCRIVPARELSLEEIVAMKEKTQMELETFIHGALCYCYSGQCLFSSLLGGRSGNRGRCAQPCRQPYEIRDAKAQKAVAGKEQYPLSLKDLCTLPLLPKLMAAGIDSFKIEGRMKSPEYVAGVTAMYRKYMDRYEADPDHYAVEPEDLEFLSGLYVRSELSTGYYEKHNGQEMVTLYKPGYAKTPQEVIDRIRENYLETRTTIPVNLAIELRMNYPAVLTAVCGEDSVTLEGMEVMPAQKKPLTKEDVTKQLGKTGGSVFLLQKLDIRMEDGVFLPVSALNELRRNTLDALADRMVQRHTRTRKNGPVNSAPEKETLPTPAKRRDSALYVSALNIKQALEALDFFPVKRLYVSSDAVLLEDSAQLMERVSLRKKRDPEFSFFLTLPVILREYSIPYWEELTAWMAEGRNAAVVDGLQAGGLSGVLWAKKSGWGKKLSLNHNAYVFNAETWRFFMHETAMDSYTAPLELNRKELKRLPVGNREMVVYGKLPMMISAGCVKRTAGECKVRHSERQLRQGIRQRSGSFFLKDRYQTAFPVLVNCRHCMNTIYNSVPLSLHQYLDEIRRSGVLALRMDFTDESAEETRKLLRFFADGEGMPPAAYTTGHYKKGVQ